MILAGIPRGGLLVAYAISAHLTDSVVFSSDDLGVEPPTLEAETPSTTPERDEAARELATVAS